jgi:hypothetical protein
MHYRPVGFLPGNKHIAIPAKNLLQIYHINNAKLINTIGNNDFPAQLQDVDFMKHRKRLVAAYETNYKKMNILAWDY